MSFQVRDTGQSNSEGGLDDLDRGTRRAKTKADKLVRAGGARDN